MVAAVAALFLATALLVLLLFRQLVATAVETVGVAAGLLWLLSVLHPFSVHQGPAEHHSKISINLRSSHVNARRLLPSVLYDPK